MDDLIQETPRIVKHGGRDCLEFHIKVTIPVRWARHFLAMLKKMQELGGIGSSRTVAIYSDGDGDFQPKFEYSATLDDKAEPGMDNGENYLDYLYDAG